MNRYHLEVISSSVRSKRTVEADLVGWSDAGLYEFVKLVNGRRQIVAYYPVSKTIIDDIEYDIETGMEQ